MSKCLPETIKSTEAQLSNLEAHSQRPKKEQTPWIIQSMVKSFMEMSLYQHTMCVEKNHRDFDHAVDIRIKVDL